MYLTNVLCIFITVCLAIILWKRRKYYYLSYKLPGPFALPIIGNMYEFLFSNETSFIKYFLKTLNSYPERFRYWIGPMLFVVDGETEDLDLILNKCLDKAWLYKPIKNFLGNGLLTAPADLWKKHRKIINKSFNPKLINDFSLIISKRSNAFAAEIETWPTEDKPDAFLKLFEFSFKTVFETLCDSDSSDITNVDKYINNVIDFEETITKCLTNPLLTILFLLQKGVLSQKLIQMTKNTNSYLKKIMGIKISQMDILDESLSKSKNFLNQLIILNKQNILSDEETMDEFRIMMITASETTSLTLSIALMVLGIYPNLQEKIFNELDTIFDQPSRESTIDDLKKMKYLEQVINEVLRLFYIVPIIFRKTPCEITLSDGTILPPNTGICIPICRIHTNPKIWKNPLKFDPDRFLPEEFKKLPKNSFIPFSLGVRNCIGYKYGMQFMKTVLSEIMRKYKIITIGYKSSDEIDFDYAVIMKPSNGCSVRFEKRS